MMKTSNNQDDLSQEIININKHKEKQHKTHTI